jgi:hypothetical protein
MKIGKSGDISCWRTEPHRRANNGIKHPRGEDDRRAGFSLNDDDLSFRSPFGVEPAHLTAVKRMPAVMDLNVLADMGRMDPRWKLRYAADFFGGLLGRGRGRFARQLKTLQNALGRLNDIEVHKRVAHDIVRRERSPRRADKALAMGFVSGHEDTRAAPCIAAVAKAAKRLADIPPYRR